MKVKSLPRGTEKVKGAVLGPSALGAAARDNRSKKLGLGKLRVRVYGEQEIESTFRRRWRSSESCEFLSFPLSSPLPMRLRIVIFILFRESGKRKR